MFKLVATDDGRLFVGDYDGHLTIADATESGYGYRAETYLFSCIPQLVQLRKTAGTVALFAFAYTDGDEFLPEHWKDSEVIWEYRSEGKK
jgi:hypothetical protein